MTEVLPIAPKEMPFSEAFNIVGQHYYAEAWTGRELQERYCYLLNNFRHDLHRPTVSAFLKKDFDNSEFIEHCELLLKKLGDAHEYMIATEEEQAEFTLVKQAGIFDWQFKNPKAEGYVRCREVYSFMLNGLRNGDILSSKVSHNGTFKKIDRECWFSRGFDFDFVQSLIHVDKNEENEVPSRLMLETESIEELLKRSPAIIINVSAGKISINDQLLQKLRVRASKGELEDQIGKEARELHRWAKEELVPSVQGIENTIRADYNNFSRGKSRK